MRRRLDAALEVPPDTGPAPVRDGGPRIVVDSGWAPSDGGPVFDCRPGTYQGAFTGEITSEPASGTVTLTLEEASKGTGEFTVLAISGGRVEGLANDIPYHADVVGELDCTTLRLVGGRLVNGDWNGFPWDGIFDAAYDPEAHAFRDGTWAASDGVSAGTWMAALL